MKLLNVFNKTLIRLKEKKFLLEVTKVPTIPHFYSHAHYKKEYVVVITKCNKKEPQQVNHCIFPLPVILMFLTNKTVL